MRVVKTPDKLSIFLNGIESSVSLFIFPSFSVSLLKRFMCCPEKNVIFTVRFPSTFSGVIIRLLTYFYQFLVVTTDLMDYNHWSKICVTVQ